MLSAPMRIVTALTSVDKQTRIDNKRKLAELARTRSEYHQQRADYWYRLQVQAEAEACELEDEGGGR